MTHEIFYLQQLSRERLTTIIFAAGITGAVVLAFALYLHWKDRHARKAEHLAREKHKAERRRQRRGQRHATPQ